MCDYCSRTAHDLVTARATANRIRTSTQCEITYIIEVLQATLDMPTIEQPAWIDSAIQQLRFVHRDLDKLPRN